MPKMSRLRTYPQTRRAAYRGRGPVVRCLITAIAASTAAAVAGPVSWTNASGGSWQTPGNWSPANVPTASDDVSFDKSSSYTVSFSADAAANNAANLSDYVQLSLAGHTLALGGALNLSSTSSIAVWQIGGGTVSVAEATTVGTNGYLWVSADGAFTGQAVTVGSGGIFNVAGSFSATSLNTSAGSQTFDSGSITINGGTYTPKQSAVTVNGTGPTNLSVAISSPEGASAGPVLNLSNGASTSYANTSDGGLFVGINGGTGTINVSGASTLTTPASDLTVGSGWGSATLAASHGTLAISGASHVSSQNGTIIGRAGGSGLVTVGSGSSLSNPHGGLFVGYDVSSTASPFAGQGTLNITGGSTASDLAATYVGYIGGNGTVTVDGSGSTLTGASLNVGVDSRSGVASRGTVNVTGQGLLSTSGTANIGARGGTGSVSVVGVGSGTAAAQNSRWTHAGSVYLGGDNVGPGNPANNVASGLGDGTLSIANGASATINGNLTVWHGGTTAGGSSAAGGTVKLAGGTLNVNGDLNLAGQTQMQLISLDRDGTKIIVTGSATLNTTFVVTLADGVEPGVGRSFDLFDGTVSPGSTYSVDVSNAPLSSGLVWDTSDFAAGGDISVSEAPEPGTAALGVLVAQPLLALRRRRKS